MQLTSGLDGTRGLPGVKRQAGVDGVVPAGVSGQVRVGDLTAVVFPC